MDEKLWNTIGQHVKRSDFDGAASFLERLLSVEPSSQFKGLLHLNFTNPPSAILSRINQFIDDCQKRFDVKAVYFEMNGFDINYDRWFFDFFGYSELPDDENDTDWLCDWQSDRWPDVTLEGLESAQKDFEIYDKQKLWNRPEFEKSKELALLLVMTKFAALISAAIHAGSLVKPVLVLATAHDFDIIAKIADGPTTENPTGRKRHDIGRIMDELQSADSKLVCQALGKLYTRVPKPENRPANLVSELIRLATVSEGTSVPVRQMAVMVLPKIASADPTAKNAVLGALKDSSSFVRRQALEAMISFEFHTDAELDLIRNMEKDSDKSVASWSEIALRNIRLNAKRKDVEDVG